MPTKANVLVQFPGNLIGAGTVTGAQIMGYLPSSQRSLFVAAGEGIAAGAFSFDELVAAYPVNVAALLTLSGTTAQTLNVMSLSGSTITGSYAGSANGLTSALNTVIIQNLGPGSATIAPGSSNGLPILGGTAPTLTISPGATSLLGGGTGGFAVGSGSKNLTITPAASSNVILYLGGT